LRADERLREEQQTADERLREEHKPPMSACAKSNKPKDSGNSWRGTLRNPAVQIR
jgi:hypothetical protein